eukprot:scaffold29737_cov101-Isochrysis_galbana.AAC.1
MAAILAAGGGRAGRPGVCGSGEDSRVGAGRDSVRKKESTRLSVARESVGKVVGVGGATMRQLIEGGADIDLHKEADGVSAAFEP